MFSFYLWIKENIDDGIPTARAEKFRDKLSVTRS